MVNAIIDFSKQGFGDTQMFGLFSKRPELLERAAAMAAHFRGGEGGLIEPELVELMRLRGANLNACIYCATVRLQPVADAVKPKEEALGLTDISEMAKSQAVPHSKPTAPTAASSHTQAHKPCHQSRLDRIAGRQKQSKGIAHGSNT